MKSVPSRRFRRLAGVGAIVAALFATTLPQVAQGYADASTGKLFSTSLTTNPASPVCAGASGVSMTFKVFNVSTQTSIKFGSANVNLPAVFSVSASSAMVTTSAASKAAGWTAAIETVDGVRQIRLRNASGAPKNQITVSEWVAATFTANVGNVASTKTFTWGQDSTAGALVDKSTVYVKQSNNFSGTGNDLVPKAGGTKASLTVQNCVDVSVTKSHSPATVTVDNNVLYTVTVANVSQGASTADGVVLTDTPSGLPTILESDFSTPCNVSTDPPYTLTCDAGTLTQDQTRSVTYFVQAPSTVGTMTNAAAVTSTQDQYAPADCTSQSADDASNNCDFYEVTVEPTSDGTQYGYLCVDPALPCDNSLSITGSDGKVGSSFTLNSGAGIFSFEAFDTCTVEPCTGGTVLIDPNCAPACRGLMVTEFATSLERTAADLDNWRNDYSAACADGAIGTLECWNQRNGIGSWIWVDKTPSNGPEDSYPIPFCNSASGDPYQPYSTQNASGPNGGWETSTTMPFPCMWKYQQVGPPGSNKLQVQIVIDGNDPTTSLRK